MQGKFVGRSVSRLEDRPLVTGQGRFAADVSFPHQLHLRVVRSTRAHAKLRSVDIAAAPGLPHRVARLVRRVLARCGLRSVERHGSVERNAEQVLHGRHGLRRLGVVQAPLAQKRPILIQHRNSRVPSTMAIGDVNIAVLRINIDSRRSKKLSRI